MKPSSRRRVEREIRAIMKQDGDHCSSCRKPLAHNSRTFGGVNAAGTTLLVGECCQRLLKETILSGLYVDRPYGDLAPSGDAPPPYDTERESAEVAISVLQQGFAFADQQAESISNLGGIPGRRPYVTLKDTAWKKDDAEWFRKHPDRSHRLRPLKPGEESAFPENETPRAVPAGHELQVLVRQVAPGQRIRLPFIRNTQIPIPDVEAVIHALFDIFGDPAKEGVVSIQEVVERAMRYEGGDRAAPQ